MRFRREFGDGAKNCCSGGERIVLLNRIAERRNMAHARAIANPLPARRNFHIFENCEALVRFRRRTRLASRAMLLSRDGEICRKPFWAVIRLVTCGRTLQISVMSVKINTLFVGGTVRALNCLKYCCISKAERKIHFHDYNCSFRIHYIFGLLGNKHVYDLIRVMRSILFYAKC